MINAVKYNLTKLTTKSSLYFRSVISVGLYRLSVPPHCTTLFKRGGVWNVWGRVLAVCQNSFGPFIDFFSPPPSSPTPQLLTQCDRCLDECVAAHGWVAGIASHGSVILSRGRLVTVEAPGYPRHPSSIQHDAVVK